MRLTRSARRAAGVAIVVGCLFAGPPAVAGPASALECDGLPVTITGTDGDDVIDGTDEADVIATLDGFDIIRGHGGNDRICAGPGGDVLRGGPGDDRLFGQEDHIGPGAGDDLFGGAGDDFLDGGYQWHYDDVIYRNEPAAVHADLQTGIVITSRGTDTIYRPSDTTFQGTHYDDVVEGSDLGDSIFGLRGNDILNGHDGPDTMLGGAGNDAMNGGEAKDTLRGDRGDDVLDSVDNGFNAVIDGGPGDDHLIGTNGWDNFMFGGPGNDWIEAFGDGDRIKGGFGDDILDGGTSGDKGNAGGGIDTCISIEKRKQCEHHAIALRRPMVAR